MRVQILSAAEERERGVVALEEEMARRRRDLEHDHSTRLTEAEATVRRLQVSPLYPSICLPPQTPPAKPPTKTPPRDYPSPKPPSFVLS